MEGQNQENGLTLNGLTPWNALYIVFSIGIIASCIYLTNHFYQVHYPTNLSIEGARSLCDVGSFFNCDAATFSPISNFAGIPLSFAGLFLGLMFLAGAIFPSKTFEETNIIISWINSLGCIALFIYSLAILGSLCPFCTLYYVLSIGVSVLFWKKSELQPKINIKPLAIHILVFALGAWAFHSVTQSSKAKIERNAQTIVQQFFTMPNLGQPEYSSPYLLSQEVENAPIKVQLFSDFQCPYCKKIAHQFEKIAKKYKGQIEVRYYFYPLDQNCNTKMKRQMHKHACDAAYLSACDPQKFLEIHDQLFEDQRSINKKYILALEKEHNLNSCLNNKDLKEIVSKTIAQGEAFKVQSTPTILINGVKIEGSRPTSILYAIFDEILKKN
jgi:predicted DsbA family dithiol-disulfide isomerase/uncharacterized membrane protein